MSLSDGISRLSRRRMLVAALAVLVLAAALRFAGIGWSYSNDGVDEGVMLERVLMVDSGYSLYTDLPCDQAPAAFLFGALLWGDVVSLRLATAALSIAAIAACMLVSHRLAGRHAMLVTGVLLAVDFAFVRESRLFSLDALSASLLALSVPLLMRFVGGRSLAVLALAGVVIGLSTSVKLLGAVALLGIAAFLAYEAVTDRGGRRSSLTAMAVLAISSAAPVAAFMVYLGPSEMLQGMVFDQGHRGFDAFTKLSLAAFFGLNLAYVIPLIRIGEVFRAGRGHRLLLFVASSLLAFMVLQPLVFLHHMVYLSPVLAILAGTSVARLIESKYTEHAKLERAIASKKAFLRKAALPMLAAGLLISAGLSTYGIVAQERPSQAVYGEFLSGITGPDDWVICGDPLIAAYAGRMTPPEVVNVAERQYPELTLERLQNAVLDYGVAVVVVCYHLNDFEELPGFLEANGFSAIPPSGSPSGSTAVLDLFQEGIEPTTFYVSEAATAGPP